MKIAPIQPADLTGCLPSCPRPTLTKEQVFRLWRCAIKDDDRLVDEIIEQLYENIIAFDYKRAECVVQLIVRRSLTASCALRSLLKDMRTATTPAVFIAPSPLYSEPRHARRLTRP
jgi:hypothetical protein